MLSSERVSKLLDGLELTPAELEEVRTVLWLLADLACSARLDRIRARRAKIELRESINNSPTLTNKHYEKEQNNQEGEVQ